METGQFWTIIIALLGVGVSAIALLGGMLAFLINLINRQFTELRAEMTRALSEQKADTNRQFTELREDMNRQFTEQKDATNRQFGELRGDMNRRFKEQDSRMDRMEAQHGELVDEGHRMGKRLGRIDMMLELLTQRRPSVRQMFRRRAADAA